MNEQTPGRPRRGPEGRRFGGFWGRMRNYFLTGVLFAAPLTITVLLTWSFVNWVDSWVTPLVPAKYNPESYVAFPVPGFGLVVALIALTLLGFLTANIFGRTILATGERLLNRMPLIRNVYRALKQIFETALSERNRTFRQAGLIEYPRHGLWALVFIATDTKGEVAYRLPEDDDVISVFLPTTPNPTSGFLLFVPRREVIILDMTVEDAAKLVISAGLITPEYQARTRQLAVAAGIERPGAPGPQDGLDPEGGEIEAPVSRPARV